MPSQAQDARAAQVRLIADAARARVGDRIEGATREGRSWRTAFWGAFALLAGAVGTLGFVALQPRFIPYVVAVDAQGVAVPIGPARRTTAEAPNAVRAELTRWIGYARTVSSDPHAQKEMVERAYAYATPATANVLNAYFRDPQNDARVVGTRAVRLVKVLRVTPLPPPARNTWNVLWRETEIAHGSEARTVTTWEAYLTVRRSAPRTEERKTEEQISHNPLGVYIADLSWSPVADPGSTR
jgi:type IV secretory pathway TrbF-like protein